MLFIKTKKEKEKEKNIIETFFDDYDLKTTIFAWIGLGSSIIFVLYLIYLIIKLIFGLGKKKIKSQKQDITTINTNIKEATIKPKKLPFFRKKQEVDIKPSSRSYLDEIQDIPTIDFVPLQEVAKFKVRDYGAESVMGSRVF